MLNFNTSIKLVPRILPKYQKIMEKMGIKTISDFLFYFPSRYNDFSKIVSLSDQYLNQVVTVEGIVKQTKIVRIWKKRMTIAEIIIQDKNNLPLKAVWFNQAFILETLKENLAVRLSGKLTREGKYFQMVNPSWEKATREATNTGRLVPVYRETVGITSKWIRWQMKTLLPLAKEIPDIIPVKILKKYHLFSLYTTLTQIHFPNSYEKLVLAQKRMAFEEMFLTQIKALQVKKEWEKKNSFKIAFNEKLIKKFVNHLTFKLTNAQRKASFEILKDLEKSQPMNRLLNGDVGSGKTIVALIAILQTISAGYQTALMAPTEILARQHFKNSCQLFKDYPFKIALLTNSYKLISASNPKKIARDELLKKIRQGKIDLVIGTHALIQKDVQFKNLALSIVDEQHRFGVVQRAALQNKIINVNKKNYSAIPHFLTITATPIPRTLAIAYFGSLDLSILDEMPKNRKPIITKLILPSEETKIYTFIKNEIKKGHQAFVILPLIEETNSTVPTKLSSSPILPSKVSYKTGQFDGVKAAVQEYERLSKKIFPEFKIGLLHGKLKAKEKETVMKNFKNKKIDILVSTSVVEVGIDIPNATLMIIENAERFGLAQLHQFRGRIGRGSHQSYCFLFSELASPKLKILEKTNDGFKIAEKDLALRGPGHFFGTVQSGLPDIAMKNLANIKLIKFARAEAKQLLKKDPYLKKYPLLQEALNALSQKIHLE